MELLKMRKKMTITFLILTGLMIIFLGCVTVFNTTVVTAVKSPYPVIINGQTLDSDKALTYNGITYVPLGVVGEKFDKKVIWDGVNKRVYIRDKVK